LLGEALGRKYVEKHFPPAAKARMQELVHNELLAMHDIIEGLDWMGPETRARALEKLATFNPKIGYPDKWKDYSHVPVKRDTFWDNVVAGRRFNVADDLATIGKPVDRGRWGMTPPTSDAYYNPLLNEIVFPPASCNRRPSAWTPSTPSTTAPSASSSATRSRTGSTMKARNSTHRAA
jgi:endothelin-converting enzyme/putative endopeptidase